MKHKTLNSFSNLGQLEQSILFLHLLYETNAPVTLHEVFPTVRDGRNNKGRMLYLLSGICLNTSSYSFALKKESK